MSAQVISVLFSSLAQFLIMLSGTSLLFGGLFPAARRLAVRLFLLAMLAIVVAVHGPQWLPPEF